MYMDTPEPKPPNEPFRPDDWPEDDRLYAGLADALTRDLVSVEQVEQELIAPPRRSMADVRENQDQIARDELSGVRRETHAFRDALRDVRTRGAGGDEVAYDARNPAQDGMADILIQYLVRPGYAEVRTEEIEPSAYVYHIRVDWPRLTELASGLGFVLPT